MRIYVAGPISKGDQFLNVKAALDVADALLNMGHQPFVPHLSCIWHMCHPVDYERWLSYDFEWIRVCDAVFRMTGDSPGADREVEFARSLNKQIYHTLEELR